MKARNLILSIAFGSAVAFSGCEKPPSPCITPNVTIATTGQAVTYNNCTVGGDHYQWTLADGQTSDSTNLVVTYTSPGDKTVKLTAFSKSGKKTAEVSVTTTVLSTGKVTFWNLSSPYAVDVTMNGVTKKLTIHGVPTGCNAYGCANFTALAAGTYSYTATDFPNGGGSTWSGSVTVTENGCSIVELL